MQSPVVRAIPWLLRSQESYLRLGGAFAESSIDRFHRLSQPTQLLRQASASGMTRHRHKGTMTTTSNNTGTSQCASRPLTTPAVLSRRRLPSTVRHCLVVGGMRPSGATFHEVPRLALKHELSKTISLEQTQCIPILPSKLAESDLRRSPRRGMHAN